MRYIFLAMLLVASSVKQSTAEDSTTGTMEEFRETIQIISKGVSKVLRSRNEDAITVGNFSGPPNLGSAAGPGLKQLFTEELKALNIRVAKLGTPLGLSGEYRLAKQNVNAETKQIQLEIKLTDDSGQSVADLASLLEIPEWKSNFVKKKDRDESKTIIDTSSSPEATALAMGLTVDFDELHRRRFGNDDRGFNNDPIDIIKESTDKPTAFVLNGNELRSSRTSPYGLQILVNGNPRVVTIEDGRPFVKIEKGETFKLRVNNRAPLTVSSVLTLDGINSFAFSEIRKQDGKSKFTQWIMSPQQSADIAGWHINNTTAKEFKITDFSESAAALLASDGQIGTITAVIRATWKQNETPPPGESLEPGAGFGYVGGVGFGDNVEQRVNEDTQKREYGRVRSILTIRYEKP